MQPVSSLTEAWTIGWIPYRILQVLSACSRRERRLRVERSIHQVLGDDWVGAQELSEQIGWSWQIVARTLQRMSEDGQIEGREEHRAAERSRVRRTHIYRRLQVRAKLPEWLAPQVRQVPLVGGGSVKVVLGVNMNGRSVRGRAWKK